MNKDVIFKGDMVQSRLSTVPESFNKSKEPEAK